MRRIALLLGVLGLGACDKGHGNLTMNVTTLFDGDNLHCRAIGEFPIQVTQADSGYSSAKNSHCDINDPADDNWFDVRFEGLRGSLNVHIIAEPGHGWDPIDETFVAPESD